MKSMLAAVAATLLCASTPFAGAANVALGGAVSAVGTGYGASAGWENPDLAALSTLTDGVELSIGNPWNQGTVFWQGGSPDTSDVITITLAHAASVTGFTLEADDNDLYSVAYLGLDGIWHNLATVGPTPDSGWGLGHDTTTFAPISATAFQIWASGGDGSYALAEFSAEGTLLTVPEPSSAALLVASLATLIAATRRRKQA